MAVTPLAALHRKLFDQTDGNKFASLKDRLLAKHAPGERCAVRDIFIAYAQDGQLLHWRAFLMSDIVALAEPGELVAVGFVKQLAVQGGKGRCRHQTAIAALMGAWCS